MRTHPTTLAVLVTMACLAALPAMAAPAPPPAQPATTAGVAMTACAPAHAFLGDSATAKPEATAPAWLAPAKRFHGFCPCGCSPVPDCNTSADCFGGAPCRTAISCC